MQHGLRKKREEEMTEEQTFSVNIRVELMVSDESALALWYL